VAATGSAAVSVEDDDFQNCHELPAQPDSVDTSATVSVTSLSRLPIVPPPGCGVGPLGLREELRRA
jgi:hypothetical protein